MEKSPKVSVITVTYNAKDYVERTVKSVISQTYSNIEYVVIDGVSKDGTLDILSRYEEYFDVFISEPDRSLYDAMNKAIDKSSGDYVIFMNAGDVMKSEFSLSEMMKGSKGADLIYSKATRIDEEGNTRPWHKRTPLPDEVNKRIFLNGMVICHQCMMVKRSIVPHFELEKWKISSDIDWSTKVMKNVETVHFYDAIFCLYLEGGLSDVRRFNSLKERFWISVEHFGFLSAVIQQFKILFQAIKRGSIS